MKPDSFVNVFRKNFIDSANNKAAVNKLAFLQLSMPESSNNVDDVLFSRLLKELNELLIVCSSRNQAIVKI